MDILSQWITAISYWIMWAQAHPVVATAQVTGYMTIAVAFLNQLGLHKLAGYISNLEDAILAAQTAARTAFAASFKTSFSSSDVNVKAVAPSGVL